MKLAEWLNVRPDVLVLPSTLTPFAKVRLPSHFALHNVQILTLALTGRRLSPLHQPRHALQAPRRRHLCFHQPRSARRGIRRRARSRSAKPQCL
jgi:hypothetical protein